VHMAIITHRITSFCVSIADYRQAGKSGEYESVKLLLGACTDVVDMLE
jgi:hypothetical protein